MNALVPEDDYHYGWCSRSRRRFRLWSPVTENAPPLATLVVPFVVGTCTEEPRNMEPDKCAGWEWVLWKDLQDRQDLFTALRVFVALGYSPFA